MTLGGTSNDSNIVMGGVGSDDIDTGDGTDIILGDNGQISWSNTILTSVTSTDTADGAADDIDLGYGEKTVIAGVGADFVDAAAGNHKVIGDNGELTYTAGNLDKMTSTAAALGGDQGDVDTITLSDGENQIIGGVGGDFITTADGTDHILADNGNLIFDPATQILRSANSVEDTLGGNDTLNLGAAAIGEKKVVIGGIGEDSVIAGAGDHHVLGDQGNLIYQADGILQQAINNGTTGAADTISLNLGAAGNNVVIAGAGGDTLNTGNGEDYLLGDHGELNFVGGIITSGRSTDTGEGGDDTLTLGNGDKLAIGGFGGDTITAGNGESLVLGDNGEMLFSNDILQTINTQDTSAATGGVDKITLGNGEHIAMGGTHGDTIISGTGDAILIGDNGTATFAADGKRVQVISELSSLGGDDIISAAGGNNLVLGGVGGDDITTGAGADRIFGDNGQLDYLNGILNRIATTDTSEATGGIDTIEAGDGDNMVFGGTHGDEIDSGIGNSILMGDNGFVQLNNTGNQRVQVVSELSTLGGDDDINARGGNNLAFGSVGNDRIETGSGDDVIFGDNGVADYLNGLADQYVTTDTTDATSGDDELVGGAGNDLIFGGLGNELVYAGAGKDVVVGDLGEANYNSNDSDPMTLDRVFTKNSEIGGKDEIHGGTNDDVVIGGGNEDKLYGDSGNDFISGDGGEVIYFNGLIVSVEATELFIGGADLLDGGADNDIMFGGFGGDLFYGNLSEDTMVGEYAKALITGIGSDVWVDRLGSGSLDLVGSTLFSQYGDKQNGTGFSPLAMMTPAMSGNFGGNSEAGAKEDTPARHRTSSLGNPASRTGDTLVHQPGTNPANDDEKQVEEVCYDESGMNIECVVEEPVGIDASGTEEQPASQSETPTEDQPLETEAIDGQPEETGDEAEPPVPTDDSDVIGTAAAITALAGWKLASGNRSTGSKLAAKGFSELRHQQRRVKRWDEATQRFIETEELKSVTGKDWQQALKNTTKH